jgi:hypothetical protein
MKRRAGAEMKGNYAVRMQADDIPCCQNGLGAPWTERQVVQEALSVKPLRSEGEVVAEESMDYYRSLNLRELESEIRMMLQGAGLVLIIMIRINRTQLESFHFPSPFRARLASS